MPHEDSTVQDRLPFIDILKEAGALPDWLDPTAGFGDVSDLPSMSFADSANRELPMHSKEAAYLSAVHAFVGNHPGTAWQSRLKSACHAYDITACVKQAHEVLAVPEVVSEPEENKVKYAAEFAVGPEDKPKGFYPISTATMVEDSALKLAADLGNQALPKSWLVNAATAIMKAAGELGVETYLIPDTVQELGVPRAFSDEYARAQIDKRAAAATLQGFPSDLYKEALEAYKEGSSSLADVAHFWELADRKLQVKYAGGVVEPVKALRGGRTLADLNKAAASVFDLQGVLIPVAALKTIPDTLIASVLDKEAATVVLRAQTLTNGVDITNKLAAVKPEDQVVLMDLLVAE